MTTIKAVLFDWGDTLMVDYPQYGGKMCDWPKVEAVDGALDGVKRLSKHCPLYLATNAQESTLCDIELALGRVGLLPYLSGIFCKSELGVDKKSAEFYPAIVKQLALEPHQVVMVGDSIIKDISPAKQVGLLTVWLSNSEIAHHDADLIVPNLTVLKLDLLT
jgi:putative hydrolase of the HAD superfamily